MKYFYAVYILNALRYHRKISFYIFIIYIIMYEVIYLFYKVYFFKQVGKALRKYDNSKNCLHISANYCSLRYRHK